MLYKRLFKLNSTGSTQVWEIHHSPDECKYWTVSGKLNGKMTTSASRDIKPKAGRSQHEQLTLELNSNLLRQSRKKYVEDITDIGTNADAALPGYTAILAKKWEDQKRKIKFPCVTQPKLDGIRCLATKDGFFTRGRKPIEACAHIRKALVPFFRKYPEAMLDGELYSHDLKDDFESIIKAVKKTDAHATPADYEKQKQVQYHVYDCPIIGTLNQDISFIKRFLMAKAALGQLVPNHVVVVETKFSVPDEAEVTLLHSGYLSAGYEGTMIRNTHMPYCGKRTDNLLKRKEFDDAEFEVVGVKEGVGALKGHLGAFVLKTPTGSNFGPNGGGATFRAKLEGSFDRLAWIWKNPDAVIGKMVTVRYQGLTNREYVPRFPVAISVRGLQDKSDWL